VLTVIFRKIGLQDGYDETRPADYSADPLTVRTAAAGARIPGYSTDPVAGAAGLPLASHRPRQHR
jgi:hypothetical protein